MRVSSHTRIVRQRVSIFSIRGATKRIDSSLGGGGLLTTINRLSFVPAVNCKKSICQIEIILIRAGRYLAGIGTGPSTLTRYCLGEVVANGKTGL